MILFIWGVVVGAWIYAAVDYFVEKLEIPDEKGRE